MPRRKDSRDTRPEAQGKQDFAQQASDANDAMAEVLRASDQKTQKMFATKVVDLINGYVKRLPWIEGAVVTEDGNSMWMNGGFLSEFGWCYAFTMWNTKEATMSACKRYCKDYDIAFTKTTEKFFGELYDCVSNLRDGSGQPWFLEPVDSSEGRFIY